MALPFGPYEGQDLTSYEAGNKFLPREFYSLGFPNTPPPSIANASTGITNTQAASPYIWPPQGGGGGGGGFSNTNKYGLNLDTQKDFRSGVWSTDMSQNPPGVDPMTASYKEVNRPIAQDEHGNWKYVDTNQNVYHANINAKPLFASLLEKATGIDLKGKYGLSDEFTARKLGSTMGYELDDDELDIGTRRTVPQNIITRWRENREIKRAEAERVANEKAQAKLDADAAAATGPTRPRHHGDVRPGGGHQAPSIRSNSEEGTGVTASSGMHGGKHYAQGGRIGYERGRVVNPGGYAGDTWRDFLASQGEWQINPGDEDWRTVYHRWLDSQKADGGIARLL